MYSNKLNIEVKITAFVRSCINPIELKLFRKSRQINTSMICKKVFILLRNIGLILSLLVKLLLFKIPANMNKSLSKTIKNK